MNFRPSDDQRNEHDPSTNKSVNFYGKPVGISSNTQPNLQPNQPNQQFVTGIDQNVQKLIAKLTSQFNQVTTLLNRTAENTISSLTKQPQHMGNKNQMKNTMNALKKMVQQLIQQYNKLKDQSNTQSVDNKPLNDIVEKLKQISNTLQNIINQISLVDALAWLHNSKYHRIFVKIFFYQKDCEQTIENFKNMMDIAKQLNTVSENVNNQEFKTMKSQIGKACLIMMNNVYKESISETTKNQSIKYLTKDYLNKDGSFIGAIQNISSQLYYAPDIAKGLNYLKTNAPVIIQNLKSYDSNMFIGFMRSLLEIYTCTFSYSRITIKDDHGSETLFIRRLLEKLIPKDNEFTNKEINKSEIEKFEKLIKDKILDLQNQYKSNKYMMIALRSAEIVFLNTMKSVIETLNMIKKFLIDQKLII